MKKTIVLFFGILFISGCSVYKPDSNYLSTRDYNKRVKVSAAHFDKALTPIGVSAMVVGTAAAGYWGYTETEGSNYFADFDKGERVNYSIAGGVVGAFVGFSATYLLNKAFGWGQIREPLSPEEWIKKSNDNFLVIKRKSNSDFTIMHKSAESNFIVKDIQDARDFEKAFSNNSTYANLVCKQTINNSNIKRDEYYELIHLYPANKHKLDMKKKYVWNSQTVSSIFNASDKYPETNLDVEFKSSDLVLDCSDVKLFHNRFPKSIYNRKVIVKSLNNSSVYEIKSLKSVFNKTFYLSQYDFQKYNSFVSNKGKKKYSNALYEIKSPYTIYDLESFYQQYDWLKYNEKPDEIISNYWNIANKKFSNGNKVLAIVSNLSKDRAYNNWNISNTKVTNFIADKLKYEIQTKVSYTTHLKTPNSPGWQSWVRNNNLTANMVSTSNLSYLVYGKVTNKSKFDLPLVLTANGSIYRTYKVEGIGGAVLGIFQAFAQMAGDKNANFTEHTDYLGSISEKYYLPKIKRGRSANYAITFDIGSKAGLNAFDWVKLTEEIELRNPKVSDMSYYNGNIKNNQQKKQTTALNLLHYGMPEVKVIDNWRNTEYSEEYWDREWDKKLERERLAAKRARQRENNRKNEASSLKQSNFSWKWDGNWSGGGSFLWADFPYEHEFIIMKDGKEWAKGNIEKAQKSNSFNVEFEITDYNSSLNGHEIRQYFYYDKNDTELKADGGIFTNTTISNDVSSFYSAVSLSLDFTINKLLDRIIESGY